MDKINNSEIRNYVINNQYVINHNGVDIVNRFYDKFESASNDNMLIRNMYIDYSTVKFDIGYDKEDTISAFNHMIDHISEIDDKIVKMLKEKYNFDDRELNKIAGKAVITNSHINVAKINNTYDFKVIINVDGVFKVTDSEIFKDIVYIDFDNNDIIINGSGQVITDVIEDVDVFCTRFDDINTMTTNIMTYNNVRNIIDANHTRDDKLMACHYKFDRFVTSVYTDAAVDVYGFDKINLLNDEINKFCKTNHIKLVKWNIIRDQYDIDNGIITCFKSFNKTKIYFGVKVVDGVVTKKFISTENYDWKNSGDCAVKIIKGE